MPLMLLFQVHKNFLPVFLVWFVRSEPIYYSIYLEIFVGTRTYRCCVALPVLNVRFLCVRLFVCAFHVLFALCFLTCPTVEGRHTVSHLLYCGSLSFGRRVPAENRPSRPSLGVVCLVERVRMRYMVSDGLSQYITNSTIPLLRLLLLPVCCILLIRCLPEPKSQYTLNFAQLALPPPLTPPVSLSE